MTSIKVNASYRKPLQVHALIASYRKLENDISSCIFLPLEDQTDSQVKRKYTLSQVQSRKDALEMSDCNRYIKKLDVKLNSPNLHHKILRMSDSLRRIQCMCVDIGA